MSRATSHRRVFRLVVLLLVAVLVVFLGMSWVFANKIETSALKVWHAEPTYNIEVTRVGGGRITLDDSADPRWVLRRTWVYGLRWRDGAGVIEGPARLGKDGTVTRDFRVLHGPPPRQGDEADTDRNIYSSVADLPALRMRTVTYGKGDKRFDAYLAPARRTSWAILVHGKGATPWEMARMARSTVAAGMSTLLITYRNDADQWQSPDRRSHYGLTEWRDLEAAVAFARSRGARDVVLGGASMGGSVVASYLENTSTKDLRAIRVRGAVLDCPMLDFGETIDWGARQDSLPGGLPVPGVMTWTAKKIAGLRFDIDWSGADYTDDTAWVRVPLLILHGDTDVTVPISTSRALDQETADAKVPVDLEVFKSADHVQAYNAEPERYDAAVRGFLRNLG